MTDKNVAQKKLTYMLEALKELGESLERQKKNDNNERFFFYAAERKAEEVVETAISINNMILMEKVGKPADSYYLSFTDLEALHIFTEKELESLAKTSRFRNRLAHDYINLDNKVTIKAMEDILKLYPDYMRKVAEFISG
jgi:uncharacterized protein YutE (UPF0331/DUF86 family)